MKKAYQSFLSLTTFLLLSVQAGKVHANLCPSQFANLCAIKADKAGGVAGAIVSILLILGVILTLLYLVWGGIKWITSGGDKAKIDSARGHLTAAVVGLIIAFMAFAIVNVISMIFTGKPLNSFTIPTLLD